MVSSHRHALLVGPTDGVVERVAATLRSAGFLIHRTADAVTCLDSVYSTIYDLVILRPPIPGVTIADLVTSLREPMSPSRHAGVAVIVEGPDDDGASALVGSGVNRVVDRAEGPGAVLCALGDLLDVAPRYPVQALVELESRQRGDTTHVLSRTHDLSVTGMLVLGSRELEIGCEVSFELHLPAERSTVRGTANIVRHSNPTYEGVDGIGLRFSEIEEGGRERLAGFLMNA